MVEVVVGKPPKKKPLLDLPFPLEIVRAWGDNVPPASLDLEDVLSVTKLAIFLQADTKKWAAAFCRALLRGSPQLCDAWDLLQAENEHTVSVVVAAHPLLTDATGVALDSALRELPPCLHEAAYRTHFTRTRPLEQLDTTKELLKKAKEQLLLTGEPRHTADVTRAVVFDMTAKASQREAALPQA